MIAIIDYGMGNLHSVLKAFKRMGGDVIVSSEKKVIEKAEKLVLPGVGHFKNGMINLHNSGFVEILNKKVIEEKTPILGICLGMQLFTKFSEEGNVDGLGWFDAKTVRFKVDEKIKIPHMGWNTINIQKQNSNLSNLTEEDQFYFVHSYYVQCKNKEDILATTNYGINFNSAINRNNITGVQFHPEKSHASGLKIIKNFISS